MPETSSTTLSSPTERRKITRVSFPGRVEIDVPLRPETFNALRLHTQKADSLNFSEGGIRLRLQEALEIHSAVRLRLFGASSKQPVQCAGRVAWVMQRLDLRDTPPFVYDVGVEFVNPSLRLRQFALRVGISLRLPPPRVAKSAILAPVIARDRGYIPRLKHDALSNRWHLVVTVDGTPCFSQRYPTERQAIDAWERFKRHLG